MDNTRFDSLARAMATGKSRRDVLKLLAGGVAGGALAMTAVDDAPAACHNLPCDDANPCCAGTECSGGVCLEMSAPAPAPAAPAAETDTGGTTAAAALPATGVGPAGVDSGAWLGAAVAGGAAAWFATRILRREREDAKDTA